MWFCVFPVRGWVCLVRDWECMDHVSRQLAKEPQNHSALPHQYVRSQQWSQPLALRKSQGIYLSHVSCRTPAHSWLCHMCLCRWNEWWSTWAETRLCSCWRSWCVSSTWRIPSARPSLTWTTPPITASPPVTRSPQSPQVSPRLHSRCSKPQFWVFRRKYRLMVYDNLQEQHPAAILWCQETMVITTARSKTPTWRTGA